MGRQSAPTDVLATNDTCLTVSRRRDRPPAVEGRDADGDASVRTGHSLGPRATVFVQNRGLKPREVAARRVLTRRIGAQSIAHTCLREARLSYLRWGAFGKVRQLEQHHPHLRDAPVPASPTATIGRPVEQLDVGTVVKASQAVSWRDRPCSGPLKKLLRRDRDRACRRRAGPAHPVPGRRAPDRGGSEDRPQPS